MGLHRASYGFVRGTGRGPGNHFENRRGEGKHPRVFNDYNDLYLMSMRARYRDGHRLGGDCRGGGAAKAADGIVYGPPS